MREVTIHYQEAGQKSPGSLAPLKIQYKDFAVWQESRLRSGILDSERHFWSSHLHGTLPVLDLPTDYPRPAVKTTNGKLLRFEINQKITGQIEEVCETEEVTLFMVLLAALNTLIYRYTNQTDIIVGSPIAGRTHIDLEDQIGLYLNTLPFRIHFSDEDRFSDLLHKVKKIALEAYDNQTYPFDYLVNDLALDRDLSRSPLFDIMLVVQSHKEAGNKPELPLVKIDSIERSDTQCQFDLSLEFVQEGDKILGSIEFNTDLFFQKSVERMICHFGEILDNTCRDKHVKIKKVNYTPAREMQQILVDFNKTKKDFPVRSIIQLFEDQVFNDPKKIAVFQEKDAITYQDLNCRANQLAHYIINERQLQSDSLIGVLMYRSIDSIIALLGIWKAGAAYLPIDPKLPHERINLIIKDASPAFVLVNGHVDNIDSDIDKGLPYDVIFIEDILKTSEQTYNPGIYNSQERLAYSIYTSGSTGAPKGVLIEHHSLLNFIQASISEYKIVPSDNILQFASPGFDTAFEEIIPCLVCGATLVLRTEEMLSIATFLRKCLEFKITVIDLPTAFWHQLTRELELGSQLPPALRLVIIGGEAAAPDMVRTWKKKVAGYPEIINTYGPTEATVVSTSCNLNTVTGELVPIGKPIANTRVYILDRHLRPVGLGVKGEIVIGGAGVGRGYNNQGVNNDAFVDSPFVAGDRLYRTGDSGKWLDDGNVVFLGRNDNQLKIRGYRIELGEIENFLIQHPQVIESVVVAKQDHAGDNFLVAYITVQGDMTPTIVKAYLKQLLPNYMVPDYVVCLDKLPLSLSGKIDKKQLPDPKTSHSSNKATIPMGRTEVALLELWQEILGKRNLGTNDNFFEIGGHSLKAVQLVSRIHQRFHIAVDLSTVFRNPTIKQLAEKIYLEDQEKYMSILPLPLQAYYDVSPSQRRLWLLSQNPAASVTYNMTGAYVIQGVPDLLALERAFDSLIERHESLRTVFRIVNGDLKQQIISLADLGFSLKTMDLESLTEEGSIIDPLIESATAIHFDLSKGPLFAATLLLCGTEKSVLIFSAHHIISDGWSVRVLERELAVLYDNYKNGKDNPLEPLKIHYKDYAGWQNKLLSHENLKAHKSYWTSQMSDLPLNTFPTDYVRAASKSYNGKTIPFLMESALCERLRLWAAASDATLFMTLLSAIYTLLYRYSGQRDIIVGTPIAGRDHPDLENQVGFYLNTLALRTKLNDRQCSKGLVQKVKELVLEGFDHQIYPFDYLLEDVERNQGANHPPIFNVFMALQNSELPDKDHGVFFEEYAHSQNTTSRFDITFIFTESNSGPKLEACIEYNTDLFKESTIRSLMGNLSNILQALVEKPDVELSQIEWLVSSEEDREAKKFLNLMHTIQ
jgi:amino acid adenylation domain-containing protein